MSVEEEKIESDESFTAAFDRLAETGEAPPPLAADTAQPVAEEVAPPAGGDTADEPSEPDVSGAASESVDAVDEDVAKEAETPAQKEPEKPSEQDIIDRLAQAVKEKVQPPQQPQYEPQPQAYEPQPVLTQEDVQTLQAFEKEWPDVAKAMDLRAKEQAHAIVNHIFKEFAQEFRPVAQQVMQMRQEMHVAKLHEQVTDYDDIRDKVVEWANNQPDYLRGAYQQVIQRGTPQQVADLINRYRAESAPPPAPVAPAAPTQPKALSPAVKKAAAALAPVASKRSNVVRTDDPGDFEGAFERFAGMN
jgi:hypothetical protein